MQNIATTKLISRSAYPNCTPSMADRIRTFEITIDQTKRGAFIVRVTRDHMPHYVCDWSTEDIARQDANRVFLFFRDEYTGTMIEGVQSPTRPNGHDWDFSVCPKCESIKSVKVTQEAWGDFSVCQTEGCDYTHWFSIGD